MEKLSLSTEIRNSDEKIKDIKSSGNLAGVVYGHSQEPISLKMNYSDFLRVFRKSGESHIINLSVGKKTMDVLAHEIQREPVSGDFTHIDFYAITAGEKVTAKIHLNFIGESDAIREGAILEEHIKEIEVKCLPKDLVDAFDVDLSVLKEVGNSIRVSELIIDKEKFQIMVSPEDSVVAASAPAKMEIIEEKTDSAEGDEEGDEEKKEEK